MMTSTQAAATILIIGLMTLLTRMLPFILFPGNKPVPGYISYLGKSLPFAAIGMLVIYCLKDIAVPTYPHGLPEAVAAITVVALQLWRRNFLISIGAGTIVYMLFLQLVF